MVARRYSVYHVKTELPLIIYGTSKECARAMGVTMNTFYRHVMQTRDEKTTPAKWLVYDDGEDEDV